MWDKVPLLWWQIDVLQERRCLRWTKSKIYRNFDFRDIFDISANLDLEEMEGLTEDEFTAELIISLKPCGGARQVFFGVAIVVLYAGQLQVQWCNLFY